MPAKTRKIDGKWRVVHGPDDKLVKKKGTPVDGGGHDSKKKADSQAAAINSESSISFPWSRI